MSNKMVLIAFYALVSMALYSQDPALELTFTAINNAAHVQLDSFKIMNRTLSGDTVLFWPDTVLSLNYVGISEILEKEDEFRILGNYPNPVSDQTLISMYVPEKDQVDLLILDLTGRLLLKSDLLMDSGNHSFRFTIGDLSTYIFIAHWRGRSATIKILNAGTHSNKVISLDYVGGEVSSLPLKTAENVQSFAFNIGDELLYIGYADGFQSGIPDVPEANETYTFQFSTNIPCPGTSTVTYEGQVYNTIQIFSQCWLKENLNVGTMIPGEEDMTDNGIVEKYCYNDAADSCKKYGGLYQWDEMMQYTTQQGQQCICPPGWHLPTDEEWQVLEGAVDSQYGIGDPVWNIGMESRGFDAGTNLKTTMGWKENNNGADLFGFSGQPGGTRIYLGFFDYVGEFGRWWTSSNFYDYPWFRNLEYAPGIYRYNDTGSYGFSVRCLRDY
jgi:uncharacterized protein (TIGR02145 family)